MKVPRGRRLHSGQSSHTQLTDPLNLSETYAYDLSGNLTSKTDRNGNTLESTYDGLGRLLRAEVYDKDGEPTSDFVAYAYNLNGTVQSESNPNLTSTFVYDEAGRVKKQTDSDGATKWYTYNKAGLLEDFTLTYKGGLQAGKTAYEYDANLRLSKVSIGGCPSLRRIDIGMPRYDPDEAGDLHGDK